MTNEGLNPQGGQGQNPYAQPRPQQVPPVQAPPVQAPGMAPPVQRAPGPYVPCPKCGDVNVQKVGFTWWGGVLGPSLFCHCKCGRCGATFNGKTGKSNDTAIAVYLVAGVVVGIVVCALIVLAGLADN